MQHLFESQHKCLRTTQLWSSLLCCHLEGNCKYAEQQSALAWHPCAQPVHTFPPVHTCTPMTPSKWNILSLPRKHLSTWGSLYTVSLRKCTLTVILLTYHRTLRPHSTWNMAFRLSTTHPLKQACLHDVPKLEEAEGSVRLIFISSTQNRV